MPWSLSKLELVFRDSIEGGSLGFENVSNPKHELLLCIVIIIINIYTFIKCLLCAGYHPMCFICINSFNS